nr:UDP-N-acetylglucosamine--N-acetylmuramyl-(pentapeptide) pyrophosphoryl-undecaprenol N-acetylglucosamine transferase [uncultured Campylobacter sp.]
MVICGGGTGGHLAVAKALNEEIVLRGCRTIFVGSSSGQDKMWFENGAAFSEKFFLPSSGVVNKKGLGKLFSLFNILKLAFKCRKIFKTYAVKAVVSVGGYSAAPAAFAAIISRTPLFIHEQNAVIGNLNKLLKPLAKGFFSSYFKPVFSYPVAERFFSSARLRSELKTVIFLGGSQGAAAINSLALKLAPVFKQKGVKIIHQCGKNSLESLQEEYKKLGLAGEELDLFDFDPKIELKISRADLAISRAGAGTLWELTANALPSVFVPYPHAANNHQVFNAKFLVDQNLAKFCFQKGGDIDADEMLNLINEMDISRISSKLSRQIDNGGARKIVDEILKDI